MTHIVFLISLFIILVGRLIFIIPGAIEHYQQKKTAPEPVTLSASEMR